MTTMFLLVGVALLYAAGSEVQRTLAFRSNASVAQGIVIENVKFLDKKKSASYSPIVEYRMPDGSSHRFMEATASRPARYYTGERVTVFYNPADPQDAHLDGFMENWFTPTMFGGVGLVFASIGAGFIIAGLLRWRRRRWLFAHGTRVEARFTGVEQATDISVNNNHPWRLMCTWQDPETRIGHVFLSDHIWYDPSDHVNRETLEVLVDPRNPKRYHVDIRFLPRRRR